MKIKSMFLLALPLDNTHKNVFMFPPSYTKVRIAQQLADLYPGISKSFTPTKSFKVTNGKSTLSIDEPYDKIKDYNYMCITDGTNYYFYFITGFSSLNEGTNSSTNISVEYDAWMNNVLTIANSSHPIMCVKGHMPEFYKSDYTSSVYPTFVQGGSDTIANIERASTVTGKPIILWLRVFTDGELYSSYNGGRVLTKGCYPDHSNCPVIMFPYLALDPYTLEVKTVQVQHTVVIQDDASYYLDGSLVLANTEHIIKADLTAYAPFSYNLTLSGSKYVLTFTDDYPTTVYTYTSGGSSSAPNTDYYVYRQENLETTKKICVGVARQTRTIAETYTIGAPAVSSTSLQSIAELTIEGIRSNTDLSRMFPYVYDAYYVNGTMYPIIFKKKATKWVMKIYCNRLQPYYVVYQYNDSNNLIYQSKPIPIENTGEILTLESKYDSFLRNNGNQIIAQQNRNVWNFTKSTVSNVWATATGSAKAVGKGSKSALATSAGSGAIGIALAYGESSMVDYELKAKINDIKNMQDEYNFPSIDATCNIYQDAVIFRKFTYEDETEINSVCVNQHFYGKQMPFVTTTNAQLMRLFQYVQSANANITEVKNADERREVNAIYNNGVTLWFISAQNVTDFGTTALQTLNKNFNNEVLVGV